jgi:hypothetical protein
MAPKILIVLTSADKFVSKNKDFNGKPTGWYLVRKPPTCLAKRGL